MEKSANNAVPPAAAVGKPTPQDYQRFWGDRIVRTGLGGLGAGATAASLYYLARGLSQALNKPREEEEEETPKITETKVASIYDSVTEGVGKMLPDSVLSFLRPFTPDVAPKQPNSFDPNIIRSSFGTGATWGAGALGGIGGYKLIEALHKRKKRREQQDQIAAAEKEYYDALTGGGAKKLDNAYDGIEKISKKFASSNKQADVLDPVNVGRVVGAAPLAGAGIGALIGAVRARRGKKLRTALGDAGVGGLAGLGFSLGGLTGGAAGQAAGGDNYAGEGAAAFGGLGAGLGAVGGGMLGQKLRKKYEPADEDDSDAAEKKAMFEWLTDAYDVAKRVPATVGGAYVGAGLGLGGLAAKLMYDRARERSRAKAVEEAAKSKARIAGILPTYVDPDEIAALKQQAEQSQAG